MTLARTGQLAAMALTLALGSACSNSSSSGGAGGDGSIPKSPPTPIDQTEPPEGSIVDGAEATAPDIQSTFTCFSSGATKEVDGKLVDAHGTASATRAREALNQSRAPLPSTLRAADFQNFYPVPPSQPNAASTPFIRVEAQPHVIAQTVTGQWDILVGLEAPTIPPSAPLALLVVIDTSPSMQGLGLGRAKTILQALAAHAQLGDHVQVTTTDVDAGPLAELDLASDADRQQLLAAADALDIGNEVPITTALDAIYSVAEAKRDAGYEARVILVGDGEGDVTRLDLNRIRSAAAPAKNPILFSAFGTGSSSVSYSTLFRRFSTVGRGTYAYVDSPEEAEHLMASWDQLWRVGLDDVKMKLVIPDMFYALRDADMAESSNGPATVEPQYIASGGVMTFKFRLIPCEFGKLDTSQSVTVQFDYFDADQAPQHLEQPFGFANLKGGPHAGLDRMRAVDAYSSALMAPSKERLNSAIQFLDTVAQTNQDTELAKVAELLKLHPGLNAP